MKIGDYQLLETRAIAFGQGRRSVIAALTLNIIITTGEVVKQLQYGSVFDSPKLKKFVVRLAWELGINLGRHKTLNSPCLYKLCQCLELGSLTGSISAHVKTMVQSYPIAYSPVFVEDILSLLATIESISE